MIGEFFGNLQRVGVGPGSYPGGEASLRGPKEGSGKMIFEQKSSLGDHRKGVMLHGPFFTTQRTTLMEYLVIVLER